MLDAVPHSMWIRYWIVKHKEQLTAWSIWLTMPVVLAIYWPLRNMLIAQERMVTIHLSNLTVVYICFLVYVGYFFDWLIKKFLSKRSRAIRWAALICCMGLLLVFLDAIGMKMRWSG